MHKLRELERAGSHGVVQRVTGAFLADAPVKLDSLYQALADEDAEGIAHAAHTLRGGCWYVGATRLAELCTWLEQAADAGDLAGAALGVADIEAELLALREAMDKELRTH